MSFQTDNPMVPLISDEKRVFKKLCKSVLKSGVVDRASTPYQLIRINVSDKSNQKVYMKTDIGTAATVDLRNKSMC